MFDAASVVHFYWCSQLDIESSADTTSNFLYIHNQFPSGNNPTQFHSEAVTFNSLCLSDTNIPVYRIIYDSGNQ